MTASDVGVVLRHCNDEAVRLLLERFLSERSRTAVKCFWLRMNVCSLFETQGTLVRTNVNEVCDG